MKIDLTITYDVTAADPEADAILDEIIAEEARDFVEVIQRRLEEAGVTEITMTVSETST